MIEINNGNNVAAIKAYSGADDGQLSFFTSPTNSGSVLSERMRINRAGFVGIGTNSPDYQLEIERSSDATLSLKETNGANFIIKAAGSGTVLGHTSNKHLWITRDVASGSVNADLIITNAGLVGIMDEMRIEGGAAPPLDDDDDLLGLMDSAN